jgi:hypothetical protein
LRTLAPAADAVEATMRARQSAVATLENSRLLNIGIFSLGRGREPSDRMVPGCGVMNVGRGATATIAPRAASSSSIAPGDERGYERRSS